MPAPDGFSIPRRGHNLVKAAVIPPAATYARRLTVLPVLALGTGIGIIGIIVIIIIIVVILRLR